MIADLPRPFGDERGCGRCGGRGWEQVRDLTWSNVYWSKHKCTDLDSHSDAAVFEVTLDGDVQKINTIAISDYVNDEGCTVDYIGDASFDNYYSHWPISAVSTRCAHNCAHLGICSHSLVPERGPSCRVPTGNIAEECWSHCCDRNFINVNATGFSHKLISYF